ncbi:hypothetical protein HCN44_007573 [Aphidius gifuensis]|uniref:Cytochrome c oxidase assembly protein COX16 homolog, mitochondrial n=1 Tax=Aphidius gifuensis TaxID=684658 RepID=A0A835CKT1_APHGI|nr:cytochrome c oxidase assembly protein COX16 homolog, mitochondrial [Aphidius gifuensis]XP_044018944.1 cytochrome c oxidase assembly protein COX16 homolog, mitochondrial [Aphidius gifuensis]KAF7988079.1 hypothetical protein HCN44_007573 [Aphidius gifuensis]
MTLNPTNVRKNIENFFKKKSVKYFIPFVLFVVGGSIGLREFTSLRYQYRNTLSFNDKLKHSGVEINKPEDVSLEKVYDKVKEIDTTNWENVRITRPWKE